MGRTLTRLPSPCRGRLRYGAVPGARDRDSSRRFRAAVQPGGRGHLGADGAAGARRCRAGDRAADGRSGRARRGRVSSGPTRTASRLASDPRIRAASAAERGRAAGPNSGHSASHLEASPGTSRRQPGQPFDRRVGQRWVPTGFRSAFPVQTRPRHATRTGTSSGGTAVWAAVGTCAGSGQPAGATAAVRESARTAARVWESARSAAELRQPAGSAAGVAAASATAAATA